MAKRKGEVEISFVDSVSAEDVTGSSIYIKTPKHNILLDCGMHQSNDRYKDFLTNNRRPKEYKPQDIDLVFVGHAHLDHVGLLPLLFKRGCECRVVVAEKNNVVRLCEYQ